MTTNYTTQNDLLLTNLIEFYKLDDDEDDFGDEDEDSSDEGEE